MTERDYQTKLIKQLRDIFPDCVIMKNDSDYLQGIPDLTILYRDRWATLEVKMAESSSHQPNQDYYVGLMDRMSFSAFIFPENEEEVLSDLREALGA